MKSLIPLCTLLIILSSCTFGDTTDIDSRIITLEAEIQTLKKEISTLKTNTPPIAGADSTTPPAFDGMKFEESSNEACLKKAQDAFLEAGNKQCYQAGNTADDIKNGKCTLSKALIKALTEKRAQEELACATMQ